MAKKKILFFHHYITAIGGGLCALHILMSLPQDKYELVAVLPEGKGDLKEKLENIGVRVRTDYSESYAYMHFSGCERPFFDRNHIKNLLKMRGFARIADQIIAEEAPDIVMVNSMTLCWIGKIAKKHNAKAVCFDRETFYKGWFGVRTSYIKKCLNRDFDKVVFISDYDMHQAGDNFHKYVKITDRIEIKKYTENKSQLDLPDDKIKVLYAGGPNKLKGIEVLLEAVMKVNNPDVVFVMLQFGEEATPSSRQRLKQLIGLDTEYTARKFIRDHHIEDKVILRDRTDRIEDYMTACDIVVFPSKNPHQARPIYEAGIARKPMLVSDFPNTAEFLTNENGWCIPYDDASAWASIIDYISEHLDSDEVKKKLDLNEAKSRENHDFDKLYDDLEALLTDL